MGIPIYGNPQLLTELDETLEDTLWNRSQHARSRRKLESMETSKSIPTGKGTILADVLPSSCAIRVASKTRNQQNQQRLEICSLWGSSPWWTQKHNFFWCRATPPSETIIQQQLNHKSSLFLICIGNHWWNGVTFQSTSVFRFSKASFWGMIIIHVSWESRYRPGWFMGWAGSAATAHRDRT